MDLPTAGGDVHLFHVMNNSSQPLPQPQPPQISIFASLVENRIYNTSVAPKLADPFYRTVASLSAAAVVCAVAGNSLMLQAILSTWRERRGLSHRCFYLNLIVCDLLVAALILPATCADQLDGRWFLGEATCKLRHGLSVCLMCSSVFTLTCLSWLRSLGVSRNVVSWLDRRQKMIRNELLAIGAIWLASAAISLPVTLVSEVQQDFHQLSVDYGHVMDRPVNWPVCRENWSHLARIGGASSSSSSGGSNVSAAAAIAELAERSRFWYDLAVLTLVCLLPLLSLAVAYFRICRAIYISNQILNVHKRYEAMLSSSYQASDTTLVRLSSLRHHFSLASTCNAINRRKRVATSRRMFLLGLSLVLVFAVTWLPMQCLQLYRGSAAAADPAAPGDNESGAAANGEFMHKLVFALHLLAMTNCLFNPYFLMATHGLYRRRVRRLARRFQCCCGCRVSWHFVGSADRIEMQQL